MTPEHTETAATPMFCPHIRSARADGIPTTPSEADMEAAYLHSRWLRGQVCNGEGRMLADLGYEVQRLREELAQLHAMLGECRQWFSREHAAKGHKDCLLMIQAIDASTAAKGTP